jgi:hypothetical protein
MVEASPLLRSEIGHVNSAELKQGLSGWTMYFRGTRTERAALSIPAGMLIHDELDRSQPDTLQMYGDRLRGSEDPHRSLFSTPTVPMFGVSAEWGFSDQAEWMWRCGDCGREQIFAPMDKSTHWSAHLDLAARRFACCHCGADVQRQWILDGQWVRMAPGNVGVAGYHISGIMPALSSAERLCAALERARFVELFVQGHIGLPEVSGEKQITRDMIKFGGWPNTLASTVNTYGGLDQGKKLHLVVGTGEGEIVCAQEFDDWEQVRSAMQTLRIRKLVVDALPETRAAQDLAKRFPGRVYLADYTMHVVDGEPFEKDVREPRVRCHRTGVLDWSRDRIIMGEAGGDVWPSVGFELEQKIQAQLMAPQRTLVEDSTGNMRADWIETGPDHFRHAHGYFLVACALGGKSVFKLHIVRQDPGVPREIQELMNTDRPPREDLDKPEYTDVHGNVLTKREIRKIRCPVRL